MLMGFEIFNAFCKYFSDLPIKKNNRTTEVRLHYAKEHIFSSFNVIKSQVWTHFCFTGFSDEVRLYINSKLKGSANVDLQAISLDGFLVIGQDQDIPLGEYSKSQQFAGNISEPKIWIENINYFNESTILSEYYSHNLSLVPHVSLTWNKSGNVTTHVDSLCNLHLHSEVLIVPHKMKLNTAIKACKLLEMKLLSPKNPQELMTFAKGINGQLKFCITGFVPYPAVWLDFRRNFTDNNWYDSEGNKIDYIDTLKNGYTKPTDQYLVLSSNGYVHSYSDWHNKKCSMCTINNMKQNSEQETIFYLQNLCEDPIQFFINIQVEVNILSFTSNYGIGITFNGSNWILIHLVTNETIGKLIDDDTLLVGRKEWMLPVEYTCMLLPDKLPWHLEINDAEPKNLSFSKCTFEEFTCDDGSCVNITKRCNGVYDCNDGTDEGNCNLIVMPPNRENRISPINPFVLTITVRILKVRFLTK